MRLRWARVYRAALGAGLVALVLAGCNVDTADPGSGGGGGGGGGGSFEGQTLNVTAYAGEWGDLFETAFVEPFEEATGAKVNLVLGANAEWITKLRAAKGNTPPFDLVALTPDSMRQAVGSDLVEPLDTGKIGTWDRLDPVMVEQSSAEGEPYGAPLTIGSTGLMYRTDKITTPPEDWQDIFSEEYCGHVALPPLTYNPGLEFFSGLVRSNGGELSDPADVDAAFTQLEQLKDCVVSFPSDAGTVQTVIQNGDAWIVPFWDGRAFAMEAAGQPVGFTYPSSGAVGAITSYAVTRNTEKRDLAYEFLNALTAADNQKPFGEGTWYAAANLDIDYSQEFTDRIEFGPDVHEQFTWVDYDAATPKRNEWQQRWNEIFS